MMKTGKRIWALALAAGMLAAQVTASAEAMPGNGAANHYRAQPGETDYIIAADTMRALADDADNAGRADVLASSERPAHVAADAWTPLKGRRFIARALTKGVVQVQLILPKPALLTQDLWVSGWVDGPQVRRVRALFERQFENVEMVIHFDGQDDWGQTADVAVRPPAGSAVNELVFYSYNADANTYWRIPAPAPRIDENGWLHFATPYARDIVISRGELEKRKVRLSRSSDGSGNGSGGNSSVPTPPDEPDPTPPPEQVTVNNKDDLMDAIRNGKKDIILPSGVDITISEIEENGVRITVSGGATLVLEDKSTATGIRIDVGNGGEMKGYENIGEGNTVTAVMGASLAASDGTVLVGSAGAPIQLQSGSVTVKGTATSYDIYINGDATIGTAATRRAAAPALILKDGVNLYINGQVTIAGPGEDPVLDIRAGSEVIVESGALIVDYPRRVAGGERIRGTVVDSHGNIVTFTPPDQEISSVVYEDGSNRIHVYFSNSITTDQIDIITLQSSDGSLISIPSYIITPPNELTIRPPSSLSAGAYSLKITIEGKTYSKDFTISDTVTIQSVEQIGLTGFRVTLSAPTENKLELTCFEAISPKGPLKLDRVETSDKQIYEIYLIGKESMIPGNYNISVTLPDGTTLKGQFYADIFPSITAISAARASNGTVTVTFSSDGAGDIHYGTCTAKADAPKDVNELIANGKKASLRNGENTLTLDSVPVDHGYFYLVAVNEKGMAMKFVGGAEIVSITVGPQRGTLTEGIAGTATFAVTTKNIPDVEQFSVTWNDAAPAGITTITTPIFSDGATVTICTDYTTPAGVYEFHLEADSVTSDSVILKIDPPDGPAPIADSGFPAEEPDAEADPGDSAAPDAESTSAAEPGESSPAQEHGPDPDGGNGPDNPETNNR